MSPSQFQAAVHEIRTAPTPEALFGSDPAAAAQVYRRLAGAVHPDRAPAAETVAATEVFVRLTDLWRRWRQPVLLSTRRHSYRIGRVRYRGDLATLRPATPENSAAGGDVLLKVPRDPANNDLLDREAAALRKLASDADPRYLPYLPRLVDSLRQRDPDTGVERRVNLLGTAPGLRSLAEVKLAYPAGLDPRDVAWMWRRLLVVLGLAHRAGVVHGAVLPDHVLIEPEQHGLVLVDWCYSVAGPDDRVPALVPRYRDWYPEEILARRPVGPGTDIAMATRCMTFLIRDPAPAPLARFAAGCQLRQLSRRPDDAWRLLAEFDQTLEDCFGPRRFRPFTLPVHSTAAPGNPPHC